MTGVLPDTRLARALHDGVAQRLAGVAAALGSARDLSASDRARCAAELSAAITELRELIEQGAGGPDAPAGGLERLISDFVVEGIRNAEKHAHPHLIAFSGYVAKDRIHVEVLNDGVLPATSAEGTHVGLRLIGDEAARQGGTVAAEPLGPDGWSTRLTIPRE
ncbi:MAG TPA: histidine kinase [Thermoleophilaceae bacterium]